MTRQLVTIREVSDIHHISGADNIEVATVDGWKCVVPKNQFQIGDKGLYFEIDSLIPVKTFHQFSFLENKAHHYNDNGELCHRLKTIKLKGQISQGLLMPLMVFDSFYEEYQNSQIKMMPISFDLSDYFGITKWEPKLPAQFSGKIKGNFPFEIPKTDEERIQNLWNDVVARQDTYEVTIKLDGSSMTVYRMDDRFGVCSRNYDLEETEENSFWRVARKLNLKERLMSLFYYNNIALQGELMGPGVQGNNEKLNDLDFYIFDIWLINKKRYMTGYERRSFCKTMGFNHVPVVSHEFPFKFPSIDSALLFAERESLNPKSIAEGIVFKSIEDPFFSFKIINNNYLLKYGER